METSFGVASAKQRKESLRVPGENENALNSAKIIKNAFYVIIGLTGLIVGSIWIVKSAIIIAEVLGVSQLVIAITIVAIGTSLPELAISSVAAFKGQVDIAVGNAIGSNIFNTLLVIAIVAMVTPIPVAASQLKFEYVVMLLFTCAALPFMWSQFKLNRKEATVLLVGYFAFIYFLF